MSSRFSAELLNEIFEFLKEDPASLHSCLLTNRLWCRVSVRFLWRDIWNSVPNQENNVLSTLIGCLSDESKTVLHDILIPDSKRPLFNYPSFCRVLSIRDLHIMINLFLENRETFVSNVSKENIKLLTQEILKMFMSQISYLKELTYDLNHYANGRRIPNDIIFPGANNCLKNLSELSCTSYLNSKVFCQLSQICHNIQTLNIKFNYNTISKELEDLISSQNNLKYLSLSYDESTDWTQIVPSLMKHSNTLIKLKIEGKNNHKSPLSFVTEFVNLRELDLSLDYSDVWCSEDFEGLMRNTFSHLQILKVRKFPKVERIIEFLENNGKNLKELRIDERNNSLSLNSAIAKFCPEIKHFKR